MQRIWWIIGIVLTLVLFWIGAQWLALFEGGWAPGEVRQISPQSPNPVPLLEKQTAVERRLVIEAVATGLDTPWSLVFTDSDRILVAERPGRIRVVSKGELREKPLYTFAEVSETGEEGLMSMVLDPNYRENRWLYVALAYPGSTGLLVRVMRFTDKGDSFIEPKIILDQIPAAKYHAGSAMIFGPDGKLYITTGDATEKKLAQDLGSLAGKVLRINADGSIPSDNPFSGSLVWSYGHRNSQGIAWHPLMEKFYASEHGPSVFDGPAGGDEINLIERGKNYGWPLVSHENSYEGTEAPLISFTPAEAPASMMVYSGRGNQKWQGNLFFGALRGEGIVRIELDQSDPKKIIRVEKLSEVRFGRIRAIVEAPDGSIYFTTSNRDGRGKPVHDDDRIMRIRFVE